jgi:hypothetical protein
MIQEATSRVATLWRHGIGLSARSDSDPVERVTWFCYQIKKVISLPGAWTCFQASKILSMFLSFLIYSRSILCWSLDHRIFKTIFSSYACFLETQTCISLLIQVTWLEYFATFVLFCICNLLQCLLAFAMSMIMYRYLLLALNFLFVHFLTFHWGFLLTPALEFFYYLLLVRASKCRLRWQQ